MAAPPPAPAAPAPPPPAAPGAPPPAAPGGPPPPGPGGSIPKDLVDNPPTVDPGFLIFKTPCRGRDEETQKFEITNGSMTDITFKIRGTKLDRFLVTPAIGICESKCKTTIEIQPKKIANADGFNKMDCFSVLCAPLPPGENPDVKEMWKSGGPADKNQLPRLKVAIEVKES